MAKLNLLPASHFLQQQHPLDADKPDFDLDMDMDFDTAPVSDAQHDSSTAMRPFVSAHPSPDMSDESDSERHPGQGVEDAAPQTEDDAFTSSATVATVPVPPSTKQYEHEQGRRRSHFPSESPLSHHLFLAPVPIPSSPHQRKQSSFSMNTPPGSATSVPAAPCSDAAAVDALIRQNVRANMLSHETDNAFFWHLGKLSEFSFSDRFVRSRVFDIKNSSAEADATMTATDAVQGTEASPQGTSSWRLRLYPHGRGDRHRDSEYVGLYLQQESGRPLHNRRGSAAVVADSVLTPFSSSVPAAFMRGSISSSPRRSISGASLPVVRRHVTLFIATEDGTCLAKQDLVEWFSGSEGGLGFPRIVPRQTVLDAVKGPSLIDDDEEETELGIVAGVIFH